MAWTVTTTQDTVFGNDRVKILKVSADGAESNIETGLGVVTAFSFAPISMSTAAPKIAYNSLSTGTAAAGWMAVSAAANGDVFFLTVYGR